jgi:hypothetical protein
MLSIFRYALLNYALLLNSDIPCQMAEMAAAGSVRSVEEKKGEEEACGR